jgi:hypothetical protein
LARFGSWISGRKSPDRNFQGAGRPIFGRLLPKLVMGKSSTEYQRSLNNLRGTRNAVNMIIIITIMPTIITTISATQRILIVGFPPDS